MRSVSSKSLVHLAGVGQQRVLADRVGMPAVRPVASIRIAIAGRVRELLPPTGRLISLRSSFVRVALQQIAVFEHQLRDPELVINKTCHLALCANTGSLL